MVSTSTRGSTGLSRWAWKPAVSARARSCGCPQAVKATAGTRAAGASSARTFSMRAIPSSPGRPMPQTLTSGARPHHRLREQGAAAVLAQQRSEADHELPEPLLGGGVLDGGDAVEHDQGGPELLDPGAHGHEQVFEAHGLRVAAVEAQVPLPLELLHGHADGLEVPQEDGPRLLEAVIDDALAPHGPRARVEAGQHGLPAARGAAHDDHRVAEEAAHDHGVEAGEAARVARHVRRLRPALDVEGEDGDPFGGDREGVLPLLVRAAAGLVDLDRPPAARALRAVAQHD